MKFLDAKLGRRSIEDKMLPGPSADKAVGPARAPAPGLRPDVLALAVKLGVDPARVAGTGKHDRVTMADVRRAAEATR